MADIGACIGVRGMWEGDGKTTEGPVAGSLLVVEAWGGREGGGGMWVGASGQAGMTEGRRLLRVLGVGRVNLFQATSFVITSVSRCTVKKRWARGQQHSNLL